MSIPEREPGPPPGWRAVIGLIVGVLAGIAALKLVRAEHHHPADE